MNERITIMVVEDEPLAGKVIHDALAARGYPVTLFTRAEAAFTHFSVQVVDIVLLDIQLPGMSGEELFSKIHALNPLTAVIFMTANNSLSKAVQLLKAGAFSYLNKPLEMDEVLHTVAQAAEKITLQSENRRLTETLQEKFSWGHAVFNSEKMQQVMNLVMRVADSTSTVLIGGESGTGKEVVAGILHNASSRRDRPFLKVNLAALPPTLIEAELFGAMKGAYTGAVENRTGKFEEANGGTLFLDEIGELPLEIQVKLLRVIQERELTRLGSNRPIPVDIRLITASNRDLAHMVREKQFREDLFFRLNVIAIELPPLRERRQEIPLLTDLFIKKFSAREKKNILGISKEALDILIKYDYPGNIRELENIIERAVVLARDETLSRQDLPLHLVSISERPALEMWQESPLPLPQRMQMIEKTLIEQSLAKNRFHQSQTARELGLSESGLRYRMQTLGIEKKSH